MALRAQILGGPYDGTYREITTLRVFVLEPQAFVYYHSNELAAPIVPLPVGVYDLQRYDDCQYFYVRRPSGSGTSPGQ